MCNVRFDVEDDPVQFAISCSPAVKLFADSSNSNGGGGITVTSCGAEFESEVLCGPAMQMYSPASFGRMGSMIQVVVFSLETEVPRMASMRVEKLCPSMCNTRFDVEDDAVQFAISCSPAVKLLEDSSNSSGGS